MNQSLPFSYLSVNITSTDAESHSVQLYSDITGGGLHVGFQPTRLGLTLN